jgi:SAM-dependent methyltransferase
MPPPPARSGFDAAAARYDADEADNPILLHMRARAEAHLHASFPPGSRLLELGSGTGTEAARLAARGCRIALLDVAPHLLARAAAKVRAASPEALLGTFELPARRVGELAATLGRGSLDGAYSSFGPLNCEPDLVPVFAGLAELVRPGGRLVLSVINRWCPPEVAWFAAHGEWGEARRRWGGPVQAAAFPGGPKDVTTWYYSLRELRRAWAPAFFEEHAEAPPLLWPPPYLDFLVRRRRHLFERVARLEARLAGLPGLRDLGDHTLVVVRRR